MNLAYLILGSNLDSERKLPLAVALLRSAGELRAVSHAYETAPVGTTNQPSFLNAAVLLATPLSAGDLKSRVIDDIERRLGRRRDPADKNAPRTIDIDIAWWLGAETEEAGETYPPPDPEIPRCAHLAVPLAEIAPDLVPPGQTDSVAAIAKALLASGARASPRPDVDLGTPDGGPPPEV